jgi:hypothetical protein
LPGNVFEKKIKVVNSNDIQDHGFILILPSLSMSLRLQNKIFIILDNIRLLQSLQKTIHQQGSKGHIFQPSYVVDDKISEGFFNIFIGGTIKNSIHEVSGICLAPSREAADPQRKHYDQFNDR